MKNILVLEDMENRKRIFHKILDKDDVKYVIVSTVERAADQLDSIGHFDHMYLSHDLLPAYQPFFSQYSGLRFVSVIKQTLPSIGKITIHSTNDMAARKMRELLCEAQYSVEIIPFYKLKEMWEFHSV